MPAFEVVLQPTNRPDRVRYRNQPEALGRLEAEIADLKTRLVPAC